MPPHPMMPTRICSITYAPVVEPPGAPGRPENSGDARHAGFAHGIIAASAAGIYR